MLDLLITFLVLGASGEYEYNIKQPSRTETKRVRQVAVVSKNEAEAYVYQQMGDSGVLLCRCESGCDPLIDNPSGKYMGLFQYDNPTWSSNCTGDIYDYKAQVECTIRLLEKEEKWRWPNCP